MYLDLDLGMLASFYLMEIGLRKGLTGNVKGGECEVAPSGTTFIQCLAQLPNAEETLFIQIYASNRMVSRVELVSKSWY